MPDTTSPSSDPTPPSQNAQEPTPQPVPPPEVPPETGHAEPGMPPPEPPDDDDDETVNQLDEKLTKTMRALVLKAVSRRDIEQVLVELTKRRANEILDMSSDNGLASRSLLLPGVSVLQILTVRRWLEAVVAPAVLAAADDAGKGTED